MKKMIHPSEIEWTDYAMNPYFGCAHFCRYNPVGDYGYGCYAHWLAWRFRMEGYENWHMPHPQYSDTHIISNLPKELSKIAPGTSILLSSMTDPYQPLEEEYRHTREALRILSESDKHILILTKSQLVCRDIDMLMDHKNVEVGLTITGNDDQAKIYEPKAPLPSMRRNALTVLKRNNVRTFVSIEPWLPGVTDPIQIITDVYKVADRVILGSLNHTGVEKSEYAEKLGKVEEFCKKLSIPLLVKKELKSCIPGEK